MEAGLPALPAQFITPSIPDLEGQGEDDDYQFAQNTEFLHQLWQVNFAQKKYGGDHFVVRSCNLAWRVWSNPQLGISNQYFNHLWRRCRETLVDDPFETYYTPAERAQSRRLEIAHEQSQNQPVELRNKGKGRSSDLFNDVSRWPLVDCVDEDDTNEEHASSSRGERSSVSTRAARPILRRSTSSGSKVRIPTIPANTRGRTRPSNPRHRSQNKSQQLEDSSPSQAAVPQPAPPSQESVKFGGKRVPGSSSIPAFELGEASSWQSDESHTTQVNNSMNAPGPDPNSSLTDANFRAAFIKQQQRQANSLNIADSMRKTRSSVRFADHVEINDLGRRVERESSDAMADGEEDDPEEEAGASSELQGGSDEEDELGMPATQLRRTESFLSKQIQEQLRQSGSLDVGLSQPPQPKESKEAREKREYLLSMGRTAGAPRGPTKQPGSGEDRERYRSPSPGATF